MADTNKIGAFTIGKAELSKMGDGVYQDGSLRSITDTWAVVMANGTTQATPKNVTGLPALDAPLARNDKLKCAGYTFKQRAQKSRVWDIEVEYNQSESSTSISGGNEAKITELTWSTPTHQVDLTTDQVTKKPVTNSAGDGFDSVPQTDVPDIQLNLTRKEKKLNFDALKVSGTINDKAVRICGFDFPKHCALINITVEDTLDTEAKYRYSVKYQVTFRRNYVDCDFVEESMKPDGTDGNLGWDIAVADCGFNVLGDDDELVKIVIENEDGEKTEPSLPLFLDGAGHRLPDGGNPKFYRVSCYPETDFSALDLPKDVKAGVS